MDDHDHDFVPYRREIVLGVSTRPWIPPVGYEIRYRCSKCGELGYLIPDEDAA